jgi:coatomer protein complex subunit alpha (xenin)
MVITNSKLEELCTVGETTRVKSGAWDACGVFVYATATHVKYLLPNGDSGIVRSLDNPIYITSVTSTGIHYLDREHKMGTLAADTTEYQFKVRTM